MGWLTNVIFKDREIKNERLELTDKNSLYFLSTGLTLHGCTIVLKVPARNLVIKEARFIDCTFDVKQELKNDQGWISGHLKGCRFKGRLSGCDFGYWPEYGSDPWYQHGFIEDCDFTEARMDGCRVMDCDPRTLRFPKWPCFTIFDPISHAPELRSAKWPGLFGRITIDHLHTQPARTRSVTLHAPSVAKRMETTEEELRAVIEQFDCIVY